MSDEAADFKVALRQFMASNGKPLKQGDVSYYNGWDDWEADLHVTHDPGDCEWIVPEGVLISEDTFVEWGGTFGTDTREMAVDVTSTATASIHCTCGTYQNMSLRFVGAFGDVLRGTLAASGHTGTPGIPI